ncbi:MAG: hypothetical protein JRL30_10900 [Deltaproteobacteria bacterium]|nr:hypothetical protein [Deltaproteobacteria bacterium]
MKKTGLVLLIIVLVIGGLLYYLWHQATLLPEWYKPGAGDPGDGTVIMYGKGAEAIKKSLERHIEGQIRKAPTRTSHIEVELSENDANKLLASIILENASIYHYLKAIKASKTRIRNGDLDFGVVLDASQILKDASEHGVEGAVPELKHLSRWLKGRKISLGFTGKCGLKDGRFEVDENGYIRIGALTFSLKTISKRLGVSEDRLKRTVEDLKVGELKIDSIEAIRNKLLLKGSR